MTMTRTSRTRSADSRRASILDATQRLISDRGAAELTVEDITSAAGIAKGTFYLYFKTKHDVLAALRDRLTAEILADHEARLEELPATDHAGRLTNWLEQAVQGRVGRANLHDALFHEGPGSHGDGQDADSHIAMLALLIAEGAEAGDFDVDDPDLLAALLYHAMHGAAHRVIHRPEDEVDTLVHAVQELALRAVLPSETSSGAVSSG